MTKKKSVSILLAILIITTIISCKQKEQVTKRPNIIYIMTDDHGYQAISCYNGALNQTPNIDRIANEGIMFTHGFVTN